MQHPFIDNTEIAKLSLDEIGKKVTELTEKLTFASYEKCGYGLSDTNGT